MKLRNILSVLLLTAFISFPAIAMEEITDSTNKGKKMSFEDAKAKHIDRIEKYIAKLQEKKSCIQSASDRSAIKECKSKYKMDKKSRKNRRTKD